MSEQSAEANKQKNVSSKTSGEDTTVKQKEPKKELSFSDYVDRLSEDIENSRQDSAKNTISELIVHELKTEEWQELFSKYHVLIQYDGTTMRRIDADNIYKAIKKDVSGKTKDILLVLYSFGGDIASAYLISKLCREYTKRKFVVAVPRRAKSAATLICCGADEIHMGSLSELGPLDPQFHGLPALGLKNTIRQIAETVSEFPKSSNLFSEYLAKTIAPIDLGYYDRIVDSASQYARRLLLKRCIKPKEVDIQKLTTRLVYEYSDHGFVIDKSEATEIFGKDVVKIDSKEYAFANQVYTLLRFIERFCDPKFKFYFIGNLDTPNSVGLLLPES